MTVHSTAAWALDGWYTALWHGHKMDGALTAAQHEGALGR
jgi:hypothetical protein